MGRRKIEIRAIRDDRNRSVTFLKRKGGLFKKAYELGVLCSVDVAVIVFGNNKKLYQFSSGDINETLARYQYHAGAPHEHKGPIDFEGKRGGGDWEDDEDGDDGTNDISPPVSHMHDTPEPAHHHHHLQYQPGYRHMRQATASASPPQRHLSVHRSMTPQSQSYSRPASRMAGGGRRAGSNMNLNPQSHPPSSQSQQQPPGPYGPHQQAHHHQHSMPQNDYSYTSNPQYYPAPPPPPPLLPQLPPVNSASRGDSPQPTMPPMHDPYTSHIPPHTQYQAAPPPPAHTPTPHGPQSGPPHQQQYHMHHIPSYGQRQHSVPPEPPNEHTQQLGLQTSALDRRTSPHLSNTTAHSGDSMLQPRPLGPQGSSTHSIFTPIDDSRSLLAQHWGGSSALSGGHDEGRSWSTDRSPQPHYKSPPRSNNIDPRITEASTSKPGPAPATRSRSRSPSNAREGQKMTRSNTMQSDRSKPRLKLKVQIPGEPGEASVEVSAVDSTAMSAGLASAGPSQQKGVVLPPPSPSARNPLLSAGATGPNNPFAWAKPSIPASSGNNNNNSNSGGNGNGANSQGASRDIMETPLSALPSRVMDPNGQNQMLPSPSELWSIWGAPRPNNDNMMPSPIQFNNTPVLQSVPNFRELAPSDDRKRRADGEAAQAGLEKRIKT